MCFEEDEEDDDNIFQSKRICYCWRVLLEHFRNVPEGLFGIISMWRLLICIPSGKDILEIVSVVLR